MQDQRNLAKWFNYIPSKHLPLNKTRCSRRNFSIGSTEEKFISLDTARQRKIFLGTRAERNKEANQKCIFDEYFKSEFLIM